MNRPTSLYTIIVQCVNFCVQMLDFTLQITANSTKIGLIRRHAACGERRAMQEAPKPSGRASKQARGGAQHAPSRDRSAVSRRRRRAAEDAQLGVGGQDRRGLDRHPADLLARHRIRAVRRGRAATGRHSPPHRVPARGLPAALRRRTAAVTGPAAGQPAARRAGAGAGAGAEAGAGTAKGGRYR